MGTWRLQIRDPRGDLHDVFATAEPTSSTTELETAIDALGFHARPLGLHGDALTAQPTFAAARLQNGDIISCGRIERACPPPGPGPSPPPDPWRQSGPEVGRSSTSLPRA